HAINDVLDLARTGMRLTVAIQGYDDLTRLAYHLVEGRTGPSMARAAAFRSCSETAQGDKPVVLGAVVLGVPRRSPSLLARLVGVSHRTLLRSTKAWGLPLPSALIGMSCCLQ